ncbi:hypothetical protein RHECNPAF_430030 [Rhizobium etli CNPAF512]|nr:hypothetical protein RHECNPAF_430030 [Rhizobium etli CNPAF512]
MRTDEPCSARYQYTFHWIVPLDLKKGDCPLASPVRTGNYLEESWKYSLTNLNY